jgi:uncharacterized protein YcbK (DUF882 family)
VVASVLFAADSSAQVMAARTPLPPDTVKSVASAPALGTPALPALRIVNPNNTAEARVGLYDERRTLDEAGLVAFRRVAALEGTEQAPLNKRLIQLVFKAAYELGATRIILVSTVRPKDRRGRGGYHTTGDAVDFQLPGVPTRKLASYLRKLPRVGVGVYTHPKTQYVHLDVRDQSYHWLDSSPPGKTWREARLRDANQEERDAAYRPEDDLPKT